MCDKMYDSISVLYDTRVVTIYQMNIHYKCKYIVALSMGIVFVWIIFYSWRQPFYVKPAGEKILCNTNIILTHGWLDIVNLNSPLKNQSILKRHKLDWWHARQMICRNLFTSPTSFPSEIIYLRYFYHWPRFKLIK